MDEILERLKRLETLIKEQNLIGKEVLNFAEAKFSTLLFRLLPSTWFTHLLPSGLGINV